MAEEDDSAEKSFEATPQKLEEARKKGEVARSADLNAAASYLGLILALVVMGPWSINTLGQSLANLIGSSDRVAMQSFDSFGSPLLGALLTDVFISLSGIFLIPIILVLVSLTLQRVWIFAPTKLNFKLSRISPISGIKNKFGLNGLFEFLKSVIKLVVVSGLLVWLAYQDLELIVSSSSHTVAQIAIIMADSIVRFLILIFVMSIVIGGIDYFWQYASHLRKNRMSRKELEDETKKTEGDPYHKQTRKQRGYEIAMNQMLAEVPKANVIIVNPTHFAVALQWDKSSLDAPECTAKGVDHIAARIREVAEASNVPIHSDPPTARAIHATVEIGQQIRPEHYRAVAVAIRFAEDVRKKARPR